MLSAVDQKPQIINSNRSPKMALTVFASLWNSTRQASIICIALQTIAQVSTKQAIKFWLMAFQHFHNLPKQHGNVCHYNSYNSFVVPICVLVCCLLLVIKHWSKVTQGKKKVLFGLHVLIHRTSLRSFGIKLDHCRNLKTGAKQIRMEQCCLLACVLACSCFRTPAQR